MDISDIDGLTTEQAKARLQSHGYNELPDKEKRNFFKIFISIISEPMIILLIVTVTLYFILGDKSEAIILTLSIFSIIGISIYQDTKTEKSLSALRDLSSPLATVVRDGKRQIIPSREVVVGDIVVLDEGVRVPADAKLLYEQDLKINESLLTGESDAVEKKAGEEKNNANKVFSGTMIVRGSAIAEVTAIGEVTEIGKIGVSLSNIQIESTRLQKEIHRVVKIIAILAVLISLSLVLLYAIKDGNFIQGLLAGLTLAMAILPEEFPVILTVFMSLGAWRLAQKNVLTRRTYVIETLGSASVLCVDKTGTLTQNQMKVLKVVDAKGEIYDDFSKVKRVLRYGMLASPRKPFDPMEEALLSAGREQFTDREVYGDSKIIKTYPFGEGELSLVNVWRATTDKVALKGAPETVFDLCHLTRAERELFEVRVKQLASDGLRVLGVAKGLSNGKLPKNRRDLEFEFIGLIGLADPIKTGVKSAIKTCHDAGIRIVMMTGDYRETAINIGREAGLDCTEVMNGADFEKLSREQKLEKVKTIDIFSRVTPMNKLTIVNALKTAGEVVAMTGDGVNDAPALKSANIGIAMGKRGTDVAREAASIVLLDDRFTSIVRGIRLGRRIYTNLKKAMSYIISIHLPIVVMSFIPVMFGWPIAIMPAHIVLLEIIMDPSCTLVFESMREERGAMKKPPRRIDESIFSKQLVIGSLLQGLIISVILVVFYKWLLDLGWAANEMRAMAFLVLVSSNLFIVLVKAGWTNVSKIFTRQNRALLIIMSAAIVLLAIVYSVPFVRSLFEFGLLRPVDAAAGVLLGLASVVVTLPIVGVIDNLLIKRR